MRGVFDSKSSVLRIAGYTERALGSRYDVYLKGDLYLSPGRQSAVLANLASVGLSGEAASELTGQFVIIVHDRVAGQIAVARDQIGQQPIYFAVDNGLLWFASSVAELLSRPNANWRVSEQGIYDYLVLRRTEPPTTMLRGVSCLRPGSIAEFGKEGCLDQKQYDRDVPLTTLEGVADSSREFADYRGAFRRSVEQVCATAGDRRISVLSSGGVDSSLLVAEYRRVTRERFSTYYVGCTDYEHDRANEAEFVSSLFDTSHQNIYVDGPAFAEELPTVIETIGLPLGSPSAVLRNHLYAALEDSEDVLLSGEGADSLYGGYYIFDLIYRFYCKNPAPAVLAALARLVPVSRLRGDVGRKARLIRQAMMLPPDAYFLQYDTIVHVNATRLSGMLQAYDDERYLPQYKKRLANFDRESILNTVLSIYQSTHIADYLQTLANFDDAHGLQHRHPFISVPMRDAFNRVPWSRKVGTFKRKKLVIELAKEVLPEAYFKKPKEGFGVPVYRWFRDPRSLGRYMDLLNSRAFRESGYFKKAWIDDLLSSYQQDRLRHSDYEDVIWPLVNLRLWSEHLNDRVRSQSSGTDGEWLAGGCARNRDCR